MTADNTELDTLAEFTVDESQEPVSYETPKSYEELTAAQRQVLTLEKLDRLHARLDGYDALLEGGIESINTVMEAAENNPMIKNILGL